MELRAREADRPGVRERGEIGRLGDPDARVGRGHVALRRSDVGTALEERRGHARRNAGDVRLERRARERESGRGLADQDRDRVLELRAGDAQIDRLRFRAAQLRLGLHDVDPADHARGVAVLRHPVRGIECFDRILEEVDRGVGHAQLEVVGRELGLQREPGGLEIRGARLLPGARGLDEAPDPSPHVDLPARVERDAVAVGNAARARGARIERHGGKETGSRRLHRGPRLRIARLGRLQGLVGHAHAFLELAERGIAEHFPPLAFRRGVVGLCDDPVAGFLVGVGRLRVRARVVGADRARSGEQRGAERARSKDSRGGHDQSPG